MASAAAAFAVVGVRIIFVVRPILTSARDVDVAFAVNVTVPVELIFPSLRELATSATFRIHSAKSDQNTGATGNPKLVALGDVRAISRFPR